MAAESKRQLYELDPTEFENLGFDLLQAAGVLNLVWRTPGSDGGRDLEGIFPARDLSGHLDNQRWYIECKRYKRSIDWPTVWEKIAYSDAAMADFLLILTTSNPSPQCETEIERWNNSKRHPKVRIWRGYDLSRILQQYAAVATKYGLAAGSQARAIGFAPLMLECTKIIQAAYVAYHMGGDGLAGLEAAAAVCEIIALKMNDLAVYGRAVYPAPAQIVSSYYPWVGISGNMSDFDDTSVRAFATVFRYVTGSSDINLKVNGNDLFIDGIAYKLNLLPAACYLLREIATWADWEMNILDTEAPRIRLSRRENHG